MARHLMLATRCHHGMEQFLIVILISGLNERMIFIGIVENVAALHVLGWKMDGKVYKWLGMLWEDS